MADLELPVFNNSNVSENGIFYFTGEVTVDSTKQVINWILDNNFEQNGRVDALKLIITSYGGDLHAAFALIDVMRGSSIPVHTIGLGIIASAGLLIFISGEPGTRIITPNTSILSHQYTWGSYGKEHELIASTKEFDLTTKRMVAHYKKCTGLEEDVIREKLLPPQDVWLSHAEAKKFNLVDSVKNL